ncbi:MAG TPA: STAS domain-containing protein [Candidatus Limnocylindrales bacterium]|nr:STAS domain-containing protein [Candidatus Limnocylindrales bacterium]
MPRSAQRPLAGLVSDDRADLLERWLDLQQRAGVRSDLISLEDLRRDSSAFLAVLAAALGSEGNVDIRAEAYEPVRGYLRDLSRSRAQAGFSPAETATFVLSLKEPLFDRAASLAGGDATTLQTLAWDLTLLIDSLAVFSADEYLRTREEIIARQGQELLELSTPVVKLWEGVVAVPLIGTLDSARTQVVMESLLERIVATGSSLAIIDITGVPTVDTLVAQHLLKTVAAARLMGADCIISGIRPQIAQTIVHLGVDLGDVVTKASLADAVRIALERTGYQVVRVSGS